MKRILAVGAHPDDIEFGCGGFLSRERKLYPKTKIDLLIMTVPESSREKNIRMTEQGRSADILKANIHWGTTKDTSFVHDSSRIRKVEMVIEKVYPTMILCPYIEDSHQDHVAVAKCVLSAARRHSTILFYEIGSTLNFMPTVFAGFNIRTLDQKKILLSFHESQMEQGQEKGRNYIEIIHGLAIARGAQAKLRYAEGFMPARMSI